MIKQNTLRSFTYPTDKGAQNNIADKITCKVGVKVRPRYQSIITEDVERNIKLAEFEEKRFLWVAAILDTIEKTGETDALDEDKKRIQAPCVIINIDKDKGEGENKVLQQLRNICNWTNGVSTPLNEIFYDEEKKQQAHIKLFETNEWEELGEAEKTRKRINCFSLLKDFDLSDYQDAREKFEGGVTQRRDLFVFPIVLPHSDKNGDRKGKAKVPEAETIAEHFAVQKERLLPPAGSGRPLSLEASCIKKIDLDQKKVKLKVRVKAKAQAQGQLGENIIENYEKKRVFWAAVMMRSYRVEGPWNKKKLKYEFFDKVKELEDKGLTEWWKIPKEKEEKEKKEDWDDVVAALKSVNSWKDPNPVILDNIKGAPKDQFKVRLFKSSKWGNKNIAYLDMNIEELWNKPEEFYWNNTYRNNYYIFPIVIDSEGHLQDTEVQFWSRVQNKTEEDQIQKTEAEKIEEQKFLIKYCLDESEVVELPTFTLGLLPPFNSGLPTLVIQSTISVLLGELGFKPTETEDGKYYITGRFFDYGEKADKVDGPFACKMLRYSTWRDTIFEEFTKKGKGVFGQTKKLGLMNHNGVDLHAAAGDKIRAVAAGTICAAGSDFRVPGLWPEGKNKGYSLKKSYESYGPYPGFSIIISHGNGFYTHYAHMSTSEVSINKITYNPKYPKGNPDDQSTPSMIGLKVKAGNVIGHSGTAVKDPHLHFEIIYIEDDGGDEKSSFPKSKDFYYLNPEHYLNPPSKKVRNYEYKKPKSKATKKT